MRQQLFLQVGMIIGLLAIVGLRLRTPMSVMASKPDAFACTRRHCF